MGRSAGRCALVVTCSVLGVACIWHAVLSLTCKRLGRSRRAISLNLSQHSPDKYMQGNRTRAGAGARGRRVPAERCTDARGDGGAVARMDACAGDARAGCGQAGPSSPPPPPSSRISWICSPTHALPARAHQRPFTQPSTCLPLTRGRAASMAPWVSVRGVDYPTFSSASAAWPLSSGSG
jgi:hypothetical protein